MTLFLFNCYSPRKTFLKSEILYIILVCKLEGLFVKFEVHMGLFVNFDALMKFEVLLGLFVKFEALIGLFVKFEALMGLFVKFEALMGLFLKVDIIHIEIRDIYSHNIIRY